MTPKELLMSCNNNGNFNIPIETGCNLIESYIKEIKGIDVNINIKSINNVVSMQLYSVALETVFNYYLKD